MQLSKVQIQDVLTNLIAKDNGLNEVLGLMLNALMHSERSVFLEKQGQPNKGNGFRYGTALG